MSDERTDAALARILERLAAYELRIIELEQALDEQWEINADLQSRLSFVLSEVVEFTPGPPPPMPPVANAPKPAVRLVVDNGGPSHVTD